MACLCHDAPIETTGRVDRDPAVSARRRGRAITWALTGLLAALTVAAGRDLWFVYDDFIIFGPRHENLHLDGFSSLFDAYNGHLMAGLTSWDLGLAHLVGLGSYLPWVLCVVVGNVFAVWVVRALMLRLGVRVLVASVAAPMLMLWGPVGWVLLWGPESAFLVAVSLCLCQLLISLDGSVRPRSVDALGALAGVIAVLIHSSAVLGPVVVVGALVLRRLPLRAAVAAAPGVLFGVWLLTLGDISDVTSAPSGDGIEGRGAVRFAWRLVGGPLSDVIPGAFATVALVALVGFGVRLTERAGGAQRILGRCCAVQAALTVVVLARGRSGAIADLSQAGRYVSVVAVLTLPFAVLVAQDTIDRLDRHWVAAVAWSVVVAVAVVPNTATAVDAWRAMDRRGTLNRARLEAVAADPRLDALPADDPVPVWRQLDAGDVRRLRDEGLVDRTDTVDEAVRRWLDAEVFEPTD